MTYVILPSAHEGSIFYEVFNMKLSIKAIKCKNGKVARCLCLNGVIITFDVVAIARALDVPISYVENVESEEVLCQ